MLRVHVDLTRTGEPWQHRVGRQCRARLTKAPVLPRKRPHRKPQRDSIMERLGMHIEGVPR